MFKKTLSTLAVLSAMSLTVACSDDDDYTYTSARTSTQTDTEVEAITTDTVKANYVAMAYAAYSDSLTTAQALQEAVDAFIAAPTEDNLTAAKAAYKVARAPYQESEIMRWDSNITVGKDLTTDGGVASVDEWEGQVNAWPLDENHIVSIIEGSAQIDTALLLDQNGANDNEANVTTGVHAIEFMLWGEDTHGTDAGAGERAAVEFDVNNCADALCDRRAQYLKVATDLLVDDLVLMQAEWSADAVTTEGTLAYNFTESELALDYILGSIHAMATDELAGARMNSGLTLGDPEEEHDCFSDLSHVAIYHNFQGVKNAFYGNYGEIDGPGIGDLIREADETTYSDIDEALTSIETHMAQILAFGEDETNPVKFDQIIGQASTDAERQVAEAAVAELIGLDAKLKAATEVLSLNPIDTTGGGDGD
ncbi:iron-regulated protein [Catenovulum sp. SM1970]|uniref:imelysin family protein n=1 Tax=Marinifaba aquimaris TaxID=2741323 RepID=UPI001572AFEE|nr:imelysin family protein [Marinifaba aquimaris]NTS78015.1 iron-regulated protein [Marinifaba aquimaris]